jgi:hypothetical protein
MIMNATIDTNIFVDYHPEAEQPTLEQDIEFTNDNGGMNSEIADNYAKLKHAAMQLHDKKNYHWSTKNKSFIELHKDLKTLGVKNNKFFLALYDKVLEDVDPFMQNLPLEIQARIAREIIRNPWYFLREICRIPMDGKPIVPGGGSPFLIDRNSAATWFLFLNGIDTYASKPRQCGKTQDAIAKINYAYNFGSLAATITLANKDLNLNKMNLARLKAQRDMLPMFLQAKNVFDIVSLKILKETSNVTSMKNPVTNNNIVLLPTANSEAKADGLGRGYTSSIQLWDEFDWTPYNTKIIDCSVFAFNTASANAKANKSLYGRLFTSTPGNIDSRDGQSAEEFIKGNSETGARGMLVWNDSMFDMDIRKLYNVVHSPKSYNGIVFVEHTWKQLKKSYEWYEKACEGVRYNPEVIAREINLQRLRGTSKSPFKRTDIMYLINNVLEAKETVDYSDNLSPIRIYDKINKRTPYLLVVDPAEGLSGDNMAMTLINPYTEKPIAEFESPYITQPKMSKMIVKFMDNYCPKSVIVVENNKGRELLHNLLETKYASNVWFDTDKLGNKESIDKNEPDTSGEKALGFNTNTKTRPILYGILENMVSEEPDKLNSKLLVDAICALERTRTGRIEAAQGKHDDMVMAYLIGICVRRMSTNLEDYGIVPGNIDPADKIGKPKTTQEVLAKLKELAELLPENMRKQFMVTDKADIEAEKYKKDMQVAIARNSMAEHYAKELSGEEDDMILDNPASYYDTALDKDLDDIIGNFSGSSNDNFDINDWL